MMFRIAPSLPAFVLVGFLLPSPFVATAFDSTLPQPTKQFLEEHCLRCHGPEKQKGRFRIDTLGSLTDGHDLEHWQDMLDRMNLEEMPPEDEPQPSPSEAASVRNWLTETLDKAIESAASSEVVLRRLNRSEYDHTIRDLLGIEGFSGSRYLPEDDSAHGFDNNAATLVMSPLLLEMYMEAADEALRLGLAGFLDDVPEFQTQVLDPVDMATPKWIKPIRLSPRYRLHEGKLAMVSEQNQLRTPSVRFWPVSLEGNYRLRVKCYALRSEKETALLGIDGGVVDNGKPARFNLGAHGIPNNRSVTIEVEQYLREKETFRLRYINSDNTWATVGSGGNIEKNPDFKFDESSAIVIESLEVDGPFFQDPRREWPLSLPANPEETGLERILTEFATRAYRRPTTQSDLTSILSFARDVEAAAGFKEAVKAGFQSILCSPKFLYLDESPGYLDEFAIASRLSYFLWSSMPDEELFQLAADGSLSDPSVRSAQVKRMIASPKSRAFVENFAGQWLHVRKVGENRPDSVLYPEYNEWLEQWVIAEPLQFFETILKAPQLSITEFLDSDFAVINEGLAKIYEIDEVKGSDLRRVSLKPEHRRGGVLGMSSLMSVTSNGTVSSPVVRGAWLLENILGTPPPPPPPDVPAIESDISGLSTIKEQLDKHREAEACAGCHAKIDPLGFALENYDVMGQWRQHYRIRKSSEPPRGRGPHWKDGAAVEANGMLGNGGELDGIDSLKTYLNERRPLFARCLTEKLLTYALGRHPSISDRPAIDAIVAKAEAAGFQLSLQDLLIEIANSKPFLTK